MIMIMTMIVMARLAGLIGPRVRGALWGTFGRWRGHSEREPRRRRRERFVEALEEPHVIL